MKGRGKYKLRRTIGSFLKKQHTGQMAYDKAMSGVGMYSGRGAYKRRRRSYRTSNDLVRYTGDSSSVPSFSSARDETGALTVSHKEYIRDIYGNPKLSETHADDFTITGMELNPGIEATFPWLSQVASNFEEYEFKQLMFTYRSTIADVSSANGQVGTVIMTTNYNASDPLFNNKAIMMGYAHSESQKTNATMLHGVECDPRKLSGSPGKYVRTQGLDQHQDIKSYDHGNFQIGVANTPLSLADNTIGELWVSYTVALRKPKYHTKEGFGISRDIFRSNHPFDNSEYDVIQQGLLKGLAPLKGIHNSIGCKLRQLDNRHILLTFPAWYAGNLEIAIRMRSYTQGFTTEQDPTFNITRTGNVVGVFDMTNVGGTTDRQTGQPIGMGMFNSSLDNDTITFTCHVRVDIASNSVDNTINFQLSNYYSIPSNICPCAGFSLEITEYNSTFVSSPTDNTPIYVNDAGTVIPLV